ncbi:MAG: VOC family protein [Candidatus Krumholzibacteriota bacterium]|nr:VOC family protein [Candidatus Krumholzibacteriota bacterium]
MRAVSVTFRCRNLQKMKRWYSRILGWEITEEGPNYCYMDAGGLTFGLLSAMPHDWYYPTGSATFLDVEIEDPITTRSVLAERGVAVKMEETTEAALFLHVEDPEGNIVSFFKAASQ